MPRVRRLPEPSISGNPFMNDIPLSLWTKIKVWFVFVFVLGNSWCYFRSV